MKKTSRAYAVCAFEHAKDNNTLDKWYPLFSSLSGLSHTAFKNPHIAFDPILTLIEEEISLEKDQIRWLSLLHKHRHFHLLPRICKLFLSLYENHTQNHSMQVTTSRSLSLEEQQMISDKLHAQRISFKVDPVIIGGMIIDYRGKIIDFSYQAFLNQLHTNL